MSRPGIVGLLLLAGCRSSLDLESGRAYECSADAGAQVQCPQGWRCGDDGRCLDPSLGVARRCEAAETGCGGGWKCGLEQVCFDPKKTDGPARACSDPALHCADGWRCGLDRLCFDPAAGGPRDGGALRCTNAAVHCPDGQRCGVDGLCFEPTRSPDAGAGPECERDDQCPLNWRCGREALGRRLCQPIGTGGPWSCVSDDDCEGWRCNPVELRCADVREPIPPLRFSPGALQAVLLSPQPAPGEPAQVAYASQSFTNPGSRFATQASFWVGGVLTLDGGLIITMGANDGVPFDGGTFVAERRRLDVPASQVVELAAGNASLYTLDALGAVTEYETSRAGGKPRDTGVLALRQAVSGFGELVAIARTPDGGRELRSPVNAPSVLLTAAQLKCPNLGETIDVLYSREGGITRAVLLAPDGVCLLRLDTNVDVWSYFFDPEFTGRRLFANFANDRNAFATIDSTVTHMVIEFRTASGDARYSSVQLSDWNDPVLQLATLRPVMPGGRNELYPPCPLCPGGARPTEVVPLPADPRTPGASTVLVRCPRVTTDAGVLPEASYSVLAREACESWSWSRIFDVAEARPHEEPVVVQTTAPNLRVLGGRDGQIWLPMARPGNVSSPLLLDRVPDVAARVQLDRSSGRTLLFQTGKLPFRFVDGIGFVSMGEAQSGFQPLGAVLGQPNWLVLNAGVIDVARFPLGGQMPFQVAAPPANVSWAVPVQATQVGQWLFVGSGDTVYGASVQQQLVSDAVSPAAMVPVLVPAPGLPVRALATRELVTGRPPELWVAAGDGLFRGTSSDGARWVTQRIPLGEREGTGQLAWAEQAGVRLLTTSGEVVSLPTPVLLAAAPQPGRVVSALRACDATWAVFARDGGAGLHLLGPSPPDGGLARWIDVAGVPPGVELSTAQLRRTDQDLLLVSRTGEVWDLTPPPMRDGGCP